jgi:Protein of unknown function (DUF4231)
MDLSSNYSIIRVFCGLSEEAKYQAILETTTLTPIRKQTIARRYLTLLKDFRHRAKLYSVVFFVGHFIITVGSLIVPALLSVQYTNSNDSTMTTTDFQIRIYWSTWFLSLLVTTCNAVLVLFRVDKKYYSLHTILERLRSEGWQYLELTGRYSGILTHYQEQPTHENQYKFFTHYVEKIKLKQIEDEYYKYEDATNPVTHSPDAKTSIYPPSIRKDLEGLNKDAPQSIKDVINSLIVPEEEQSPKNSIVQITVPSPK